MTKDIISMGKGEDEEEDEFEVQKEVNKKSNSCDVCDKDIRVEILGGNYGGKCRICQRMCCNQHYKDGLCPYCREKLGKK